MEEQEKIECNDSNEFGKKRDLQKQEEWCSTKWKSMANMVSNPGHISYMKQESPNGDF